MSFRYRIIENENQKYKTEFQDVNQDINDQSKWNAFPWEYDTIQEAEESVMEHLKRDKLKTNPHVIKVIEP